MSYSVRGYWSGAPELWRSVPAADLMAGPD